MVNVLVLFARTLVEILARLMPPFQLITISAAFPSWFYKWIDVPAFFALCATVSGVFVLEVGWKITMGLLKFIRG